jgi:tetratricopeptide (TPR) repeat protein
VLTELTTAVRLDPRHARAWYNLGLARNAGGDTQGALEALLRAETADAADPRIPFARATILARLGNLTEAHSAALRARALNPTDAAIAELLLQLDASKSGAH